MTLLRSLIPTSLWVLSLFVTGIGLGSCHLQSTVSGADSSNSQTAPCREVVHDRGVVQICETPERVVALDPHAMDLLLSLGVQPIGYAEVEVALVSLFLVGTTMTDIKYLGDRILEPPTYIGSRNQPSLEAILTLQPDLIVGEDAENYDALSRIAPTILLRGTEAESWRKNIQTLASVFQAEAMAQAAIANHDQKIEAARATFASRFTQKRVLLVATDGTSFTAFHAPEDYAGSLLRAMGIPLISIGDNQYVHLSVEILPDLEADLIIVMAASNHTVTAERERWAQSPLLRSLPAYQNNQVYIVDYQLWSRIRGPIAAELIMDDLSQYLLEH
jgi:iron complex transport system substrate-binding protein